MSDASRHIEELQAALARGVKIQNPPGQETNPTITGPCWEPIGDQHKKPDQFLAVVDEKFPLRQCLVTWGRICGTPRWVNADNFHHYAPDAFTHAYIVPPFEPV